MARSQIKLCLFQAVSSAPGGLAQGTATRSYFGFSEAVNRTGVPVSI